MHFDFLLCSERSGSNLITKILNAHPEICGPFPSHMFRYFSTNYWRYGDLRRDENWEVFLEDAAYYMANIFATWGSSVSLDELRLAIGERSLAAVGRVFYEAEAASHGKSRVFVKENHTWSIMAYLLAHFSDAKFVWMVRDPRDMALTWRALARGGVRTATETWLSDQRGSLKAYTWLRDVGRIHRVRFEDLVLAPEETTRDICAFLGVPYDSQMLSFHEHDIVVENANKMASWHDLQSPLIPDRIGRYAQELSEAEILYIEARCAREMAYFGYQRDYSEIADPDELGGEIPDERSYDREWTPTEKEAYARFFGATQRIESRDLDGMEASL